MTSSLIVGKNSYAPLATASAYLMDSIRAASWADLDPDVQLRSLYSAFRLLEKQTWNGQTVPLQVAVSVAVAAGGTGYAVGDMLTVVGGTTESPTKVQVATLGASNAVATVTLLDEGAYSAIPTNPAATSGGTGSGCTLNLTTANQSSAFPRSGLIDQYGLAVDGGTIPLRVQEAQFELAFELSLDASLETASGTGSNISHVQAGSVNVNYFRPTDTPGRDMRFPEVVMELILPFLGGTPSAIGTVTGTDLQSAFDSDDEYTFTQGLP